LFLIRRVCSSFFLISEGCTEVSGRLGLTHVEMKSYLSWLNVLTLLIEGIRVCKVFWCVRARACACLWRSMFWRSMLWSNNNTVRILLNKTHWYVIIDIKRMLTQWIFLYHKVYLLFAINTRFVVTSRSFSCQLSTVTSQTARSPFVPIPESCHVIYGYTRTSTNCCPRWRAFWSANIIPISDFKAITLASANRTAVLPSAGHLELSQVRGYV
jgi:hypothetical protein